MQLASNQFIAFAGIRRDGVRFAEHPVDIGVSRLPFGGLLCLPAIERGPNALLQVTFELHRSAKYFPAGAGIGSRHEAPVQAAQMTEFLPVRAVQIARA